jgi:hypothetical protein
VHNVAQASGESGAAHADLDEVPGGWMHGGTPLLARRRVHSPEQGDTPCSNRTSRAAAQDRDPREAGQPVSGTAISSTQRHPCW